MWLFATRATLLALMALSFVSSLSIALAGSSAAPLAAAVSSGSPCCPAALVLAAFVVPIGVFFPVNYNRQE